MRWKYEEQPAEEDVRRLSEDLNVHPAIARALLQRNIHTFDEAKAFFRPDLKDLHDPFSMKNMDKAVARLDKALLEGEKIMVYGDYDVDGTTSVAMMSTYLRKKGAEITTHIPDRVREGYGISFLGIDRAAEEKASLLIALDCGIRAVDKVEYAREKGIDIIICDHHSPDEIIPDAVAVLNPKQPGCPYPYKGLSGCGVGFKFMQAHHQSHGGKIEDLIEYLDLLAISIGADIVPITGENRVLAYHGLKRLNEQPRPGVKAIKSFLDKEVLNITDVVFLIAPRINAAGRLAHAKLAADLLMGTDKSRLLQQAEKLNLLNRDRQDLDDNITQEALKRIETESKQEDYTTVLYDENWHNGVIGIVASRLIETYYRPTIIFTKKGELLTGSARSVSGFNLYEAIQDCEQWLERWGGHKYAAGMSLKPCNLENFARCFEQSVRKRMKPEWKIPEIKISGELDLRDIDMKFYRIIEQMAPFGPGNMRPVFSSSGLRDNGYSRTVGKDNSHLKLQIIAGTEYRTFDGIAFNLGHLEDLIKGSFRIAYTIDVNEWNGRATIQLKVKDIHRE